MDHRARKQDAVAQLVEDALSRGGFRVTPARHVIIGIMADFGHPFTASELEGAVARCDAGVGRASVYRTLALLEQQGILEKLHQRGAEHYTLCLQSAHHHHVTCVHCGRTEDIALEDQNDIVAAAERLARGIGYRPTNHVLEIYGVCPACQAGESEVANAHPMHGKSRQPH